MKRIFLLSLSLVAVLAYAEDIPKFTNDDVQRYSKTLQDVPNPEGAASNRKRNISGTWNFICCSGKYWGEIDLSQDENNMITGRFYDLANKSGGTVEGTVKGNAVLFTRNKGEQDYKLTLSDNGNTMSGFFVGTHDGSAGTEVTLTRSSKKTW